jgi:hypothetical protein
MRTRAILFILCATTFVTLTSGQARMPQNRQAASDALLTTLGIERGLIQDLHVPATQTAGFEVAVTLGNKTHTLLMQAHDIRASNFQLLVHDKTGLHPIPPPPNTTYRGVILGRPESVVAASLLKGQLHATIKLDGVLWAVQPAGVANRATHIAFSSRDNLPETLGCADFKVPNQVTPIGSSNGGSRMTGDAGNTFYTCEIACDADNSYYVKNGSDVITTQNDVVRVINGVGAIFRADVDIDYRITNVIIRKTAIYTVTGSTAILGEFKDYWNANHPRVVRDLCHLFTDRRMGNVIGVAWVGVVCNKTFGYAVSISQYSSNLLRRYNLTAHELGHNWSCPHCSNPPTNCNIMCGNTGPCFSDVSKNLIRSHRDSRSCLQPVSPRPNLIAVRKPARGDDMAWSYKGGPKHFWFLTISPLNSYTQFLGLKFLDSSLLILNGQLDQWGLGRSSVTVPSSATIGLKFYSQLVTIHGISQSFSGTSLIIGTTVQ